MRWLKRLLERRRLEGDLDRELAYHRERRVDDLVAAGVSRAEASRRVRLEFGGADQVKEECRDARGTRWIEDFIQDCGYGLRLLRKGPAFTSVAVLSLALGIGASTAIFSLMDRLMFRALPVYEPERLVEIGPCCLSYPLYEEIQGLTSLEGLLARARLGVVDVMIDGQREIADIDMVTGTYFRVLGVGAGAGRLFSEDVDRARGANPVAVISHAYWQRRFASNPAVIGRSFRRLDTVFTIIGVTPRGFFGTEVGLHPDIVVPLSMDAQVRGGETWLDYPDRWWISVMGRLKPDRQLGQTLAELNSLRGAAANTLRANGWSWEPAPGGNGFERPRRRFADPLRILMGAVCVVLLLAFTNLANLLLAKSATRLPEIAVRLAVGAGRGRVARQFLAEGLLLAIAGGTLGLALARGMAEGLVTMISNGGPRMYIDVTPDARVLLFALGISLAGCVLFSLAPAVQTARQSFQPALAELRTVRWRLGKSLIVAQMAMSVLLLIGCGLFARTLVNIYSVDSGFDRHGVVLFATNTTDLGYDMQRVQEIEARVLEELRTLPGIRSASLSKVPPVNRGGWRQGLIVEGSGELESPYLNSVGADFFATYGTSVVLGREFGQRDGAASKRVAVVNEAFAREAFPERPPVGASVAFQHEPNSRYEIVGVVKDVKYQSLRDQAPPAVYFAASQVPPGDSHTFAARTSVSLAAVGPAVQEALRRVDGSLRLVDMRTLEEHVARSLLTERMLAALGGFFSTTALLLSAVGIYGVMALHVARRRREIGIRMALGADARRALGMVLGQTARLTLAGCVIGAAAGLALARLAEQFLFGVRPNDPWTFGGATAGLLLVALAAAYLPGRSAARTNPVETLRAD